MSTHNFLLFITIIDYLLFHFSYNVIQYELLGCKTLPILIAFKTCNWTSIGMSLKGCPCLPIL